jgi:hypothetical protein
VPAELPRSTLSAAAPDRRPAIWPWLVMPLVCLLLYYALDHLKKTQTELPRDASRVEQTSPPLDEP